MLTDAAFLEAFRAASLDPSEFDHRGHVRAGWLYLTEQPEPEQPPLEPIVTRLSEDIRRYATSLGAESKFHRTITEALMRLLASHLPAERALTWQELIARHPIILKNARGLLLRYYSEDRLRDPRARDEFLEPDRKPLPHD